MSALTTIMQRAGRLTPQEAHTILAHCQANRRAPFVGIVELGFATEEELVHFMHSKLMVPIASAAVLGVVDAPTAAHVPAELAWNYAVMPVSVDDLGNLTLAMADPTDELAVSVIAAQTGAYVIRAVAPVDALRASIHRAYGAQPLTSKGPPTPLEIPAVRDTPPEDDAIEMPELEALPMSPEAFAQVLPRLVAASDRDEIMEILLDFLAEGFERVILFIHLHNQLKGRDARGSDLLIDAVTQVRIPTSGPSVFADVIHRGGPSFAPWPTERSIDRAFSVAMGHLTGNVLVLPVRIRDKTPILVFASGSNSAVDPRSLAQLTASVKDALERLIFRRKSET